MLEGQTPKWLIWMERRFQWLAVPNIAVLLVTLQGFGFLLVSMDPIWASRLALIPQLVMAGEFWRVITFLALPLSMSPIFVIFTLWFLYFILNLIENQWGAFKTTLYVLISIVVTIAYSFAFEYPVVQVSNFESSLFLAAAALFPNMEVSLFFMVPVKIKWLAWLTMFFIALQFIQGTWMDRGLMIAIFSNYLIFFGPAHLSQIRHYIRRERYKRSLR